MTNAAAERTTPVSRSGDCSEPSGTENRLASARSRDAKRQRWATTECEHLRRHGTRAARRFEPPADDPLRVDPDQRRRQRDRLAAPSDLDPAWAPRVCACQIV